MNNIIFELWNIVYEISTIKSQCYFDSIDEHKISKSKMTMPYFYIGDDYYSFDILENNIDYIIYLYPNKSDEYCYSLSDYEILNLIKYFKTERYKL